MKFYSEKLDKLFDTEKELVVAEKEAIAAEEKKSEAAKSKKSEAKVVEDAFKARNAARREYNTKLVEARKIYNDAVVAAKKVFNDTIPEITSVKDNAEESYSAALKEFTTKHPEGFHITLKDGDNVMTVSNVNDKHEDSAAKEYSEFLNSILNFWKI